MRKVKLQMQMTLDGFVAGPTGEQDWMVWNWDAVLNQYAADLANSADTLLIGRVTYEGMANYWPNAATNPDANPDELAFAHQMNEIEKVVFSTTLSTVEWNNAKLAKKGPVEEVAELKAQPGKDLIIYGGARIVSDFIKHNLIDEYHLFINPVALKTGLPIWQEMADRMTLKLVKTTVSSVGIVVLCYHPEPAR